MYRILIVDDEPAIVDGLMQYFQEKYIQEHDLCKAYSASDALDIVKKTKIDLLISDIRMPGKNGLQLIDDVLFYWPSCRIILLTGHSEFDYAYKAIQQNVDSYLLKTEGIEVIDRAVKAALSKIDEDHRAKTKLELAELQQTAAEPLFKKAIFEALLTGEDAEAVWISGLYEALSLTIDNRQPVMMIAGKVDRWEEKVPYMKKMEVYYQVQKLFAERLPQQIHAETAVLDRSDFLWFIQPAGDAGKFTGQSGSTDWRGLIDYLKGMLEPVQNSCREKLGIPVSFAIGRAPVEWSGIGQEYEAMKEALKQRAIIGQPMAIIDLNMAGDWIRLESGKPAETSSGEFNRMLGALEKCLNAGDIEGAIVQTTCLVGGIKNEIARNYMLGMERYYTLLLAFISYLNGIHAYDKPVNDIGVTSLPFLEPPVEWGAVEDRLNRLSESICRIKKEQLEKSENLMVERIHRYVNDNMGGDLSLARIAEVVYFNPSYLSRFYKQLTGRNLSDYINETKTSTAVRLLGQTPMKINEIAMKLGFESPSYFTSFFRKMVGTTPQEYRETANLKR
ncbi:response regulator transcription factor [Paenibacillus prosopidis]|uniref:Two-component system response regulator YesN n=1 Tax=Paenibacillus prosopidis TaxID=630520 RepID=A0A368W4D4_9BACL|nr:response regulator [Paenibacillus prosopidis]RCW49011.1 two-component system response regulator YesN [Paenibacillus prosopidis]